jgi:hypothetical protein
MAILKNRPQLAHVLPALDVPAAAQQLRLRRRHVLETTEALKAERRRLAQTEPAPGASVEDRLAAMAALEAQIGELERTASGLKDQEETALAPSMREFKREARAIYHSQLHAYIAALRNCSTQQEGLEKIFLHAASQCGGSSPFPPYHRWPERLGQIVAELDAYLNRQEAV